MPPQDQQQVVPQQTASPVQNQAPGGLSKQVSSAGRSTALLGGLMVFLSLISMFGVKSLAQDKQLVEYAYLGVVALINMYWIVAVLKIKHSANDQAALSGITMVMVSSFVVVALTAAGQLIKPGGGGLAGFLALILGIYLLVVRSGVKRS